MISIRNSQRKIAVDTKQLKHDTQLVIAALGYDQYDVNILLATNKVIHDYNREYRKQDKPTDIISFPYYPELKAGERIVPASDEEHILGDIIIAPEYVHDDLERWGISFEERMRVLLVHGICHLLGYDHILDTDYEIMKALEEQLLTFLKQKD